MLVPLVVPAERLAEVLEATEAIKEMLAPPATVRGQEAAVAADHLVTGRLELMMAAAEAVVAEETWATQAVEAMLAQLLTQLQSTVFQ